MTRGTEDRFLDMFKNPPSLDGGSYDFEYTVARVMFAPVVGSEHVAISFDIGDDSSMHVALSKADAAELALDLMRLVVEAVDDDDALPPVGEKIPASIKAHPIWEGSK